MISNDNNEKIINKLKELPRVTDERTKDDILQKVYMKQAKQRKRNYFPLIASLTVFIPLLIIIFFYNEAVDYDQKSSESETSIEMYDHSKEESMIDQEAALYNDLLILQSNNKNEGLQLIPKNVYFTISLNKDELSFIFKDGTIIENNDKYEQMIESILLVAKSYRIKKVRFVNSDILNIGIYDLSKPITVPN